jgi:hypothetical protein
MKQFFLFFLMSLSSISLAVSDWKAIGETTSCDEKIQIFGKEGEKYVVALSDKGKTKLFSTDGLAFHENSMRSAEYTSNKNSKFFYRFLFPAYVEGNLPKIDVVHKGSAKRCSLILHR